MTSVAEIQCVMSCAACDDPRCKNCRHCEQCYAVGIPAMSTSGIHFPGSYLIVQFDIPELCLVARHSPNPILCEWNGTPISGGVLIQGTWRIGYELENLQTFIVPTTIYVLSLYCEAGLQGGGFWHTLIRVVPQFAIPGDFELNLLLNQTLWGLRYSRHFSQVPALPANSCPPPSVWYYNEGLTPAQYDQLEWLGAPLDAVITVSPSPNCSPSECGAPPGACCVQDAEQVTCVMASDEASCNAQGGEFKGAGTTCPDACGIPVGACCLPDGTCTRTTAGFCTSAHGTFYGDGTVCADVECEQPPPDVIAACCIKNGTICRDLTAAQCRAAGGKWQGAGIGCDSSPTGNPCLYSSGQSSGACCWIDANGTHCVQTTLGVCSVLGGHYNGDGSVCGQGNILCTNNTAPQTLQEYEGLPSGATYRAPDGTWRRKR